MPPKTTLEPIVLRVFSWGLAAVVLIAPVQISLWLHRVSNEPPPEFRLVEGELKAYTFDKSDRGVTRTTLFSLTSHEGRFWTTALSRSEIAQLWAPKPTHLRFYVEVNPTYSPKQGDALKTFGLWVDGKRVQSLEEKLKEEAFLDSQLRWLSYLMYGLAIALFIFGYRQSGSK